jgi:RHS repeat-associated protein
VTTGEFYQNNVDLHVNGPLPIEVRRTYSSQNPAANEVGYGWLSGYPSYLIPASDLSTILATDNDGTQVLFRRQGSTNVWVPTTADNPSLTNEAGGMANLFNSTIVQTGGGAGPGYSWQLPDGSFRFYLVQSFNMGPLPYLVQCLDNRGNYLNFTYGLDSTAGSYGRIAKIQSSNGSSVSFTYNPEGLLTQAATADGRTVNYTYTYLGDLIGVQMSDGQNYSYQYGADATGASNHLIIEENKPDGRILQNVYDSSGRVVQQYSTVGQGLIPVVSATFDYSVPGQTTVKDALGNPTVYQYSGTLITQITDPLGQKITQTWFTSSNPVTGAYQNSLQRVTDKRGLVTTYLYDGFGNISQTEITGDLEGNGGSETVVTTATFNRLDEPVSVTDASGITTTYSYGDGNYPYLPTQIVTSKGGVTIRSDQLTYTAQRDAVNPMTLFSAGLLAQKTTASGSPYQAITQYAYNTAGFLIQKTDRTGTSDPDVITTFTYSARGELASVTDGDGRSTSYTYDPMSRPLTKVVTDETGKVLAAWTTTYDGSGEPNQVVGPRTAPASSVQWIYDGAGRVQQETDSRMQVTSNGGGVTGASAATTTNVHDAFGNLVSQTDPMGNVTTFTHDANGQLLSRTTAGLRTESFQYEPGGNVSSYTNPLGGVTLKSYTTTGKLCRQQNPNGSVMQWLYYVDGRPQEEILRNGSYWLVTYNDITQTVTRTLTRSDGTQLATETDIYDLRGNLISHTDVDGNVTTMAYDGLNRVKITTGPTAVAGSAQRTITNSYGPSAKTVSIQDGLSETTTTISDALGRALQSQTTDANGNSVRLTTYAYSADNNSVTVTNGSGTGALSKTNYTDTAGRVLLSVSGDGTFAYNTYDLDGNLTSATDQLNQTTLYSYNALNQATSQTLPDGTVTSFTYDAAGNLLNRGMAGGALDLEQTFDSAGRKLTEALYVGSASTRQFAYAYYPATSPWAGLLQTVTAPRDTVTATYDDFLRPQTVTTSGALPETNTITNYAYDNRGLATSISQNSTNNAAGPATQISRTYDGYGSLLTDTVTLGGQSVSSVSQTWDAAGRRASLNEAGSTLPAPLFSYQHRADGLLTQVTANSQNYVFSYTDNGLLVSRTNPFRTLSIDSRDPVGRILQQTNAVAGASAMVEDMIWRANSTLSNYAVTHNGTGAWNESRSYAYNARGQLVNEGYSPASGVSNTLVYTFDGNNPGLGVRTDAKVGTGAPVSWEENAAAINAFAQVTQDQISGAPSVVPANGVSLGAAYVNILVDGVSQGQATYPGSADPVGAWSTNLNLSAGTHTLTTNAVHPSGLYTATASSTFTVAGTPGGNVTNAFDADGNVTSRTWASGLTQALTWDAFGRLVKISQRDNSGNGYDWIAAYDGLGRRLQTTQQPVVSGAASGSPTVTTSIYDPQVEFLEIGVAVNGAKAWKVYGPDLNGHYGSLQGTGGLEATILDSGGKTQGVINDQFGNGVASVTGSAVTWFATRVGAYGPLPGTQAAALTDITQLAAATAWRGRRIDPTGFYDLGARYYEPTSGRFLSADPMGQAASPSLYDFAGGDPVNFFDPNGRCSQQQQNNQGQNNKGPNSTATSWWDQVLAFLNIGQKAPLTQINNFFDNNPNNSYVPFDPSVSTTSNVIDPNAPTTKNTIVISNPAYVTILNGAIYSVLPNPEPNPNENPLPTTPQSIQGVSTSTAASGAADAAQAALDAANGVLAGQNQAQTQMHTFAFVYDSSNGSYYVVDISAVPGGGKGTYLPPSQGATVLNGIFNSNNVQISPNAKLPGAK